MSRQIKVAEILSKMHTPDIITSNQFYCTLQGRWVAKCGQIASIKQPNSSLAPFRTTKTANAYAYIAKTATEEMGETEKFVAPISLRVSEGGASAKKR